MATKVLDSWALLAFFEDEPAAEEVEKPRPRPIMGHTHCY